jgi:hypothetical protein
MKKTNIIPHHSLGGNRPAGSTDINGTLREMVARPLIDVARGNVSGWDAL